MHCGHNMLVPHVAILNFDLRGKIRGEKFTVEKLVAMPQKLYLLCRSMPLLNSIIINTYSKSCLNSVKTLFLVSHNLANVPDLSIFCRVLASG